MCLKSYGLVRFITFIWGCFKGVPGTQKTGCLGHFKAIYVFISKCVKKRLKIDDIRKICCLLFNARIYGAEKQVRELYPKLFIIKREEVKK
jgi:hypothetical protein